MTNEGGVLRDRNAALYLSGVVVSGFGTSAMWLAAGVWVKSLTGSDSLAALTVFAMWAPVLAGPVLGAVADRMRRRPLLIGCNLAMTVPLCALLAVDTADRVWILFCVLFLYGVSGVIQDAAETALVATVVDRRLLGAFNGLRLTANEAMKLLAPLAGAALYAHFGGPTVALLDAATFTLAAGLFALMRVREEHPTKRRGGGPGTGPGPGADHGADHGSGPGPDPRTAASMRLLWRTPTVRPLLLAASVTMLFAGLNGAAIYAVVDRGLGHSPTYVGVLYAVQGAGPVLAGLLAGPLLRRVPERVFAGAGIGVFALSVGARAVPYDAVVLASAVGVGLGLPCVLVAALTAVQREIPDALLGRASATANTLVYAPNAVALALGAALIAAVEPAVLLPVTGAAGLLTAYVLVRTVRPGGGPAEGGPAAPRSLPS
ncbi:MFS transporter [Streptomyces paludis]|uniref:MFS transporter n=1 Tax=Streptomyces paludis TaxID=2282738 RepID=UPI001E33AABF|nr:MFS transporter [Streptomyces paludis]